MSLFTVDQRERAIVFQLGEIREVITEPGLHLQVAADPERALLRQAHPHAGHARDRALHHLGEEESAGRFVRQMAHRRREAVLHQRAGRRGARPDAPGADGQFGAARGVRQAHGPRRGLRRARRDHARGARQRRRGREEDRRRHRRRAAEARRTAAGGERVGVPAHGGREKERGRGIALAGILRSREDPRRGRTRRAR